MWNLEEDYTDQFSLDEYTLQVESLQTLMYMTGEGGTGKTRVILAITAYTIAWGHSNSVICTAITGKAASQIDGVTLHSFCGGWKLSNASSLEASKCAMFRSGLRLLIIDEVSMATHSFLYRLDRMLRNNTGLELPFGGLHVLLAGDFFQLPGVASKTALYEFPKNANAAFDLVGYHLWRSFTSCVVLTECMRFKEDPEWGTFVSDARRGIWTEKFKDVLLTRTVYQTKGIELVDRAFLENKELLFETVHSKNVRTTIVTPDNHLRTQINQLFTKEVASKMPPGQYPIRVVAQFGDSLNELSDNDVRTVMSQNDNYFDNLAPFLDIFIGLRIMFLHNVNTSRKITNGSTGVIESIHFPDDCYFKVLFDANAQMNVLLPSKPPSVVMVRLDKYRETEDVPPGLDPGVVPVFLMQAKRSKNVTLCPNTAGAKRLVSLRPMQLPFVNAIAATIYKVQGDTIQSLIVASWKCKKYPMINKSQQCYLIVSRCTKRKAILLLEEFTDKLSKWAVPPQHCLDEEKRLLALESGYRPIKKRAAGKRAAEPVQESLKFSYSANPDKEKLVIETVRRGVQTNATILPQGALSRSKPTKLVSATSLRGSVSVPRTSLQGYRWKDNSCAIDSGIEGVFWAISNLKTDILDDTLQSPLGKVLTARHKGEAGVSFGLKNDLHRQLAGVLYNEYVSVTDNFLDEWFRVLTVGDSKLRKQLQFQEPGSLFEIEYGSPYFNHVGYENLAEKLNSDIQLMCGSSSHPDVLFPNIIIVTHYYNNDTGIDVDDELFGISKQMKLKRPNSNVGYHEYSLSSCIYYNNDHFVVVAESNGLVHLYDGTSNGAVLQRIGGTMLRPHIAGQLKFLFYTKNTGPSTVQY